MPSPMIPAAEETTAPELAQETPSGRLRRARDKEPLFVPGEPNWVVWQAGRAAARMTFFHYFRLESHGAHHVPVDGPVVMVPNHPSYLDPWIAAFGFARWATWMAWEAAFSWPVFGKVITQFGAFPINTERPRPSTFKAAAALLEQGGLLGIFFEGQRSMGFGVDPPRRGAARIALQTGVPVVPVSITGLRRIWPRGGVPRPGRVVVHYHPPIDAGSYHKGLAMGAREERLNAELVATIGSVLRPDGRAWPPPHRARPISEPHRRMPRPAKLKNPRR